MRRAPCWLIGLSALAAGCGASGLDWVGEPETASGSAELESHDAAMSEPLPAGARAHAVAPAFVAIDDAGEHRRLSHTVTLGADSAPPGAPPAPGAGSGQAATTVVINNYPSAPAYAYPSYGYGTVTTSRASSGRAASFAPTSAATTTIQPGQNWAPPPSMGPSFPYHTAPAPAFERDRSR